MEIKVTWYSWQCEFCGYQHHVAGVELGETVECSNCDAVYQVSLTVPLRWDEQLTEQQP